MPTKMMDEVRNKIGDAQKGEANHRYGKHWTDEEREARRQFNLENGIRPPVQHGPQSDGHRKAIGNGNRGKKRSLDQRKHAAKAHRIAHGPRTEEVKNACAEAMRANLWKREITRPLNSQYRNKILPLVYGKIIIHELVQDKFKTFKIVDLDKEAFRPERGRSDRLVICLKGTLVFKFVIG